MKEKEQHERFWRGGCAMTQKSSGQELCYLLRTMKAHPLCKTPQRAVGVLSLSIYLGHQQFEKHMLPIESFVL
jgi:hypothetical protein